MKNRTMKTLAAAASLSMITLLTGCNKAQAQPRNVAVLALNGSNNPVLSMATVQDELETVICNGGTINFVQADSNPARYRVELSATKKSDIVNYTSALETLQSSFQALNADDKETDVVSALRTAARSLHAEGSSGTLIVAHSGLSTSGVLRFQNLEMTDDSVIPELIEMLRNENQLVDLTSLNIEWHYLADTMPPQSALTETEKSFLRSFWAQYLDACGAASVNFCEDLPDSRTMEGAPSVTVVPTGELKAIGQPVRLDSAAGVAFVADSATEVLEEERFSEAVKQLASQVRSSGCRYVLGGSTADDGSAPEKQQQFGLARAKFVKEAVAQVDPEAAEQLVPVGLGCANTSVRADDEEANRVVWFVEATSDLGQELLAVGIQ